MKPGVVEVVHAFDADGPFVRLELRNGDGAKVIDFGLHSFEGAMKFLSDVAAVVALAWPEKYRALEVASAPAVIAVIAIPTKGGGGTVPCMKGHLHADVTNARACEADPKIPPMVGAVKH